MEEHDMHTSEALKTHVSSHVKYPATKAEILMACHEGETPEDVLKAAEMHLQDKTYASADEVLKDLHMM
jgi:hypothetical protein